MTTPRPLNMPGAEPTRVNYRGDMYWRRWAADQPEPKQPVTLLEPTPAQLGRGQRVLWLERSTYGPVNKLAELAVRSGWTAFIARSRYLDELQTAAGRLKGLRPTREMHTVRFESRPRMLAGWAGWVFTEELAQWKTVGGQIATLATWQPRAILRIRTLGVTELESVIKGGDVT